MAELDYDAGLFELLHRGTPGDLGFYVEVCQGAESVLELGCGYGRVMAALDFVPQRVGLDRHQGLLERAKSQVEGVEWVDADMRDFELGRRFDRVIIPHSGMYCAATVEDLQAILKHVEKHLAPGGKVAFDAYDADAFHEEARPEDMDPEHLEPLVELESDGTRWQVFEKSSWDRDAQQMVVSYIHRNSEQEIEGRIVQRYVLSSQWSDLLTAVGLQIADKRGGFDGEPWDLWSKHRVVVAQRS